MYRNAMTTSTVMGMTKWDHTVVTGTTGNTGTSATMVDFSGCIAVVKIPANNAAELSYTSKMELFRFGFAFGFTHAGPPA
jgi:threonine synthase